MPRKKELNIVVAYGATGIVINDLGPEKSPRFELYDTINKTVLKRSNNPHNFDEIIIKKWEKEQNDGLWFFKQKQKK